MFTTERIGRTLWLWIALLCLTLLTACGGGGGSGGTPAGGSPISTTPLMTVGIINASGQSVTTITNTSAYSARAILTDAQGNPLANYVVTFSLPSSSVAAFGSTTTALTNSAGVAAVPVYAASVLSNGATTMTATAGVGTATVTATSNFAVQTTGANLTVSIVNASGFAVNNVFYTGNFYAQAVLVDSFGRPLANTVVSFSMGTTSAANFGLGTTALTNSAGVASVPIFASSVAVFGASTLTATATLGVATISNAMNFSVTSSGAALRMSILNTATGAPVTNINYSGSYTVQAVLVDGSGNPLPNAIVSFGLTNTNVASLGAGTSALTNSSGVASVSLSAASVTSIGASAVTATASVGGTTVTGVGNFSVSASGAPAMSVQIVNAGGGVTSNITYTGSYNASVTLVNGSGAPVPNTVVTFSLASSSGSSAIAQLGGAGTALTNYAGVATIPVSAVSVLSSGATTLTASATVGGLPVTANVNFSVSSSGASLTVSIVNATTNAATSNITYAGSYLAQARLVDGSGYPLANYLVTFNLGASTIATLGSVTTGLTNSSGIASVPIAAASLLSQGAGTLTATTSVGVVNLSAVANFAVAPSSVSLGPISAGSTTLASGTTTSLSVMATISGASGSSNNIVNVTFQASCGQINGSGSSVSVVSNGSGLAQAIYSSVSAAGTLCSGPVTITASTPGATAVSVTLTVASPTASAVSFVGASAPQIYVIGSGAITQSVLTYKVTTSAGTAMAGATVTFGITVNPGGVTLGTNASTVPISSTTDSNGLATVAVNSGTVPGPVNVMAALTSSCGATPPATMAGMSACTVYALSQNLTVASGPPSQRFMSLSISTFNVEAWDIDGTPTTVTVRVADRQGNPVVNGTVINFTTGSGQIGSSCATQLTGGVSLCSVTWYSQAPRATWDQGRAAVLAFTNGQKDYIDVNGNNQYDAGTDTLMDIGDPYRDDTEVGAYVSGDFLVSLGGTNTCAGSGEPYPARANTCNGLLPTTVRAQGIIMESSSSPVLGDTATYRSSGTLVSSYTAPAGGSISFYLASRANHNLPMPATTAISAAALGGTGVTCTTGSVQGTPVANINPGSNPSAYLGSFVAIPLSNCAPGNQVAVTVTSPSNLATTFIYTLY